MANIDQGILKLRFKEACDRASARSKEFGCGVCVQALFTYDANGMPSLADFVVDDFYSDATVAQYHNGKKI